MSLHFTHIYLSTAVEGDQTHSSTADSFVITEPLIRDSLHAVHMVLRNERSTWHPSFSDSTRMGRGRRRGERGGRESAIINLAATNSPSKVSILILGFFPALSATEEPPSSSHVQLTAQRRSEVRPEVQLQDTKPRTQVSNLPSSLLTEFRAPGMSPALHSTHVVST